MPKNQSLSGRWEWWSDSVWQEGQIFPWENMGYLSAVMCPKFKFGVNYSEGICSSCFFVLKPKMGNGSFSMS